VSNVHVLGTGKLRRYAVVAHKAGQFRLMLRYFPLVDSEDLAMDHVLARAVADPAWRQKYKGWVFIPCEYNNSVKINEDGTVARCT
jgi:hypothetical protein